MTKNKKIITAVCVIAVIAAAAILLVLMLIPKIHTPEVQGSNVVEMPYEEISGEMEVEKYDDYDTFAESEIAELVLYEDYKLKHERYSKIYFETRNLAVIKFNSDRRELDYYVIDFTVQDNKGIVGLLEQHIKSDNRDDNHPATYYCFLEIKGSVNDLELSVAITDYERSADVFINDYYDVDNRPFIFEGQIAPKLYAANSRAGLDEFLKIETQIPINAKLMLSDKLMPESYFTDKSLLLIRTPALVYSEYTVSIDEENGVITVSSIFSDNYNDYKPSHVKYHTLMFFSVPKNLEITDIHYHSYSEFKDGENNVNTLTVYSRSSLNQHGDGLKEIDYEVKND